MTRALPAGGPVGSRRGPVAWKVGSNQSAHHSHTLPTALQRPKPLGGNAVTGAVPRKPSSSVFSVGKRALPDVAPMRRRRASPRRPTESACLRARRAPRAPTPLRSAAACPPMRSTRARRSTTRGRPDGRAGPRARSAAPRDGATARRRPVATRAPPRRRAWAGSRREAARRRRTTNRSARPR